MEKRLIVILSASLGVALLTIAFLLGRITGGTKITPAPAATNHEAAISPPVAASIPATLDSKGPDTAALQFPPQAVPPIPGVQPPVPTQAPFNPPPAASRNTGDSGTMGEYFAKVDAIHAIGSGDPNAFAQQILDGMQGGDMSGFDNLLNSAKLALAQTAALQPPAACATYHRQLVETLTESTEIMEKVRDATKSGDLSGIAELSVQIQTLQQKINALETTRKQLTGQ